MRLRQPVSVGETRFSNRVIFGPHVTNLGERRRLSPRHVAYYRRRAAGGAGAIIVETASVHAGDWPYERAPLARECGPGWRDIAAACAPHGTRVLAALGHTGGQGTSAYSRTPTWGPSRLADPISREQPLQMGTGEIGVVIESFARAAALARQSDLAGVEIDIGPRSLLRQFQSGLTNLRDDEYGADRMLLTRSVLSAVRRELGTRLVLAVRLSCDEQAPWGGITATVAAAQAAQIAAYADLITVVRGGPYSVDAYRPDAHTPPGFNRALTAQIGSALDIPVAAQGSIVSAELAEDILRRGDAELIEMTRAQIADADFVRKLAAPGDGTPRPCVLCNQRCQVLGPRNLPVSCVGDPRSGHETTDPGPGDIPGVDTSAASVAIVGAGIAGLEAARVAAHRGARVTVYEQRARTGGADPGGPLAPLAEWLAAECRRLGVQLRLGVAVGSRDVRRWRASGLPVVLATGGSFTSRWSGALDPLEVLRGDLPRMDRAGDDPGRVVVGDPMGGPVGVRVCEDLAARGYAPTLVTPDPVAGAMLAPTGDMPAANTRLQRAGVVRRLHSVVREVADGRVVVEDVDTGDRLSIGCDAYVDAGHRLPDDALHRDTGADRIGDCLAPRSAYEAVLEGRRWALALPPAASPATQPSRTPPATTRPLSRGPSPCHAANGVTSGSPGPQGTLPSATPHLHAPIRVGPITLRNRVVFAAHLTNFATDGMPTDRHVDYYARRARGGAGLIITEEHSTHPGDWPYEKMIRGHRPEVIAGYRRITDAVHAYDGRILAQLNHNGPQSSGLYSRLPVWGPSAIPDPMFREVPVAVGPEELRQIVDGFATVARHCADGGFDGVEIQCSQSSIVRCFLSPATNRRTDDYGGPLPHRARLLLQIIDAVRREIGEALVLGVRICGEEYVEDGTTLADAVALARILDATGQIDLINTTTGVATATLDRVIPSMRAESDYARQVPAAIRAAVSIPVIGAGRIKDPAQAEQALADGQADLVAVVRGQIADPDFASKPREHVAMCLSCNQECVGRVGTGHPIGCVVNPYAGHEGAIHSHRITPGPPGPDRPVRDVLVVGAGPAGLQAAISAAAAGHRVRIVEAAARPGGQIALAAAAPHRAELGSLVGNLVAQVRRHGIPLALGTRLDAAAIRRYGPDVVVLATGALPQTPPWADGDPRIVDVRDLLGGTVAPRGHVLVVDELGFHQATSVAEHLAERGCTVEIVTPAMVVGQDLGLTLDRSLWRARARVLGIRTRTDLVPTAVAHRGDRLTLALRHHPTDTVQHADADWVVCALQQRPDDTLWVALAEADCEVRRVGDCVVPRRADSAIREGAEVGASL